MSTRARGARFRYQRTLKCLNFSLALPLTVKENDMRIVIYILMILCVLLVILCYALCVIASEADERADRMYRKWKEEHNDRT